MWCRAGHSEFEILRLHLCRTRPWSTPWQAQGCHYKSHAQDGLICVGQYQIGAVEIEKDLSIYLSCIHHVYLVGDSVYTKSVITFYIVLRFMYDCRGFGTSMWPSLLWWFSIMATMVRVVATNVLFRVCRYWGLSLVRSLYRIINLLA